MIFSAHILSLIICILAAAFAIRRRFSFPLFLLVVAHPAFWLEESESKASSSILFVLCALALLFIPKLLPSEDPDEGKKDRPS